MFHRGREFITVHLQLFAAVAGLLPVQLAGARSDSNLLRGEKVKYVGERDGDKEEAGD